MFVQREEVETRRPSSYSSVYDHGIIDSVSSQEEK